MTPRDYFNTLPIPETITCPRCGQPARVTWGTVRLQVGAVTLLNRPEVAIETPYYACGCGEEFTTSLVDNVALLAIREAEVRLQLDTVRTQRTEAEMIAWLNEDTP